MLLIRQAHKDKFGKIARRKFERRALDHCKRIFPAACEKLGEPALRERITRGVDAADACGVRKEYDVVRYIDLMFVLAEDFDKNPRYPWAARILGDKVLGPTTKMDRLYERAQRELAPDRARRRV